MKPAVENLQFQVRCIGLQDVIDDRSVGRILACRFFRGKRGVCPCVATIAKRVRRLEQEIGGERLRTHLAHRRDVVENPERTPVRSNHDVVVVYNEVAHRGCRQVLLQRPQRALVQRDPERRGAVTWRGADPPGTLLR